MKITVKELKKIIKEELETLDSSQAQEIETANTEIELGEWLGEFVTNEFDLLDFVPSIMGKIEQLLDEEKTMIVHASSANVVDTALESVRKKMIELVELSLSEMSERN
jgi:ATP-dependent 26S proteasome regulatory subunit